MNLYPLLTPQTVSRQRDCTLPQSGLVEYDIEYDKVEVPKKKAPQLPPLAAGAFIHIEVEEQGRNDGKPFWRLAEVLASKPASS